MRLMKELNMNELRTKSLRTFIGSKDFISSKRFYADLGFKEIPTSTKMSYFHMDNTGFYLQDYYVKEWIENSMLFLEVDNLEKHYEHILRLELPRKYDGVQIREIVYNDWGNEYFIYDPSGILWHVGEFN